MQDWLFAVTPAVPADRDYQSLSNCAAYLESLQNSEGFKNPEGLKGGVSGVCKAGVNSTILQRYEYQSIEPMQ